MSQGSSSSEWSIEEVLQTAFSTKPGKKERADITVRQRTRTNMTASQSLLSVSPCKRKAGEERDTQARREESRKDEAVPAFLSLYPPSEIGSRKGAAQPNREYQLSTKERSLLKKFWIEYHKAGIYLLFSTPTESLQRAATSTHRICIWSYAGTRSAQRLWATGCLPMLGVCRSSYIPKHSSDYARLWMEQCMLRCIQFLSLSPNGRVDAFLFPVWHQSQFYLIVAYPRYKRCDYYNTMGWRKRHWEYPLPFFMVLLAMLVILMVRATEGTSWCVARSNLSESLVKSGLDYACRSGANCGPIKPGGRCYLPNTLQSHASYALNSYYQSKSMGPGSCGFSPAAAVVSTDPSM